MKKEEFELHKVKVDDAGKVEVTYLRSISDGEVAYVDTHIISSPRICHPDLLNSLNELSWFIAESNELLIKRKTIEALKSAKKGSKEIESTLNKIDAKTMKSITVTGVSLQGDEENRSIVITGKRKIHHTGGALNSPKITLNGDSFKFEESLREPIDKVVDETYEYLFNLKSSDGNLFADEGTNPEDKEKAKA